MTEYAFSNTKKNLRLSVKRLFKLVAWLLNSSHLKLLVIFPGNPQGFSRATRAEIRASKIRLSSNGKSRVTCKNFASIDVSETFFVCLIAWSKKGYR